MTRIDFYIEAADKVEVACRLAAKAMARKLRVLIFSSDEVCLQRANKLLWTQPATSFVPHCMAHESIATDTPVLLARSVDEPPQTHVLVNLDDSWPASFARFERLVEVVSQDEADKQSARVRYRFYKDRGYRIETHSLASM